jgi:hypothetical protein
LGDGVSKLDTVRVSIRIENQILLEGPKVPEYLYPMTGRKSFYSRISV